MSISINMPYRSTVKRNVIEGTILGTVLTAISYLVATGFGWIDSVNYLEAFAVFTSYLCTYLCVMERRLNYPVGVVTTIAYCILFYQWGLFASMVVNAYLSLALIYGWFRWRADSNTRPVTFVAFKWIPVYILVVGASYAGIILINSHFGGTMVWTDSVILVGTILAQFLLDNKKIETWAIWAIVNVFAIYTYFTAGLPLAAFQYVFFLANTMYGAYMWNVSRKATTEPIVEEVVMA